MQQASSILDKKFGIFTIITCLMIFVTYNYPITNGYANVYILNNTQYLLYNDKCRIPRLDPFNAEVKKFYQKHSYVSCRNKELLTYVTKINNGTQAMLHVNETLIPSYAVQGVTCCYTNISRSKKDPDNAISESKCIEFKQNFTLPENPVVVKCMKNGTKSEVYKNVHVAATMTKKIMEKVKRVDKTIRPLNVLFVGIDSVSRLNMMRAMPKTRRYLNDNGWLEMQSYNKMADNTFPNFMAILTGRNNTSGYDNCNPKETKGLDNCNFIWKDFSDNNYVTGYAEDCATISTFNYHKKGFDVEPVDYYLRSYMVATENKLKCSTVDEMVYCTGPESAAERILNAAKDFAVTYKDVPNFGFFWMNSFSHNKLNAVTRMDDKLKVFFETITDLGILEKSVVLFFSDHGIRFGKILETYTGWLEERLPMFYIWIPQWFRESYPMEYENLQLNSMKLTNPYDVYMTLQDILVLSGGNYTVKQSEGCPKCKSLFKEVDIERSCEESSIDWHWCACANYNPVDPTNSTVQEAAKFTVKYIMDIIRSKETKKCAKYSLKRVISARISTASEGWYKNETYFLIIIETVPSAVFEVTIKYNSSAAEPFEMEPGISRLDRYWAHSGCIDDTYLKLFCHCQKY